MINEKNLIVFQQQSENNATGPSWMTQEQIDELDELREAQERSFGGDHHGVNEANLRQRAFLVGTGNETDGNEQNSAL